MAKRGYRQKPICNHNLCKGRKVCFYDNHKPSGKIVYKINKSQTSNNLKINQQQSTSEVINSTSSFQEDIEGTSKNNNIEQSIDTIDIANIPIKLDHDESDNSVERDVYDIINDFEHIDVCEHEDCNCEDDYCIEENPDNNEIYLEECSEDCNCCYCNCEENQESEFSEE